MNERSNAIPSQLYTLGYRGNIEGLRAIAILLIVAAHAKATGFDGGFVGVDVFFVLSGYLITGLLVKEFQTTGTIRLTEFYVRRLRRLLPALLVMLVGAFWLGSQLVATVEQSDQALAGAFAALWISNLHFAFAELDYFGAGAESNLFLHTWSLGVEEQFYLVWPLLVLLVLTTTGRGMDVRRLRIAMVLVLATSLASSIVLTRTLPQLAFYMMPTRAWQFALGALVFLSFGRHAAPQSLAGSGRAHRQWWGWLGLALILASALWLDESTPYPGAWALLPSVGAGLVLAGGEFQGVGRLLSVYPLQLIGRVSYSWYLWHWPVLLLGALVVDTTPVGVRLGLLGLSLAIAIASYRLVETPIRRGRLAVRPAMVFVLALGMMVSTNLLGLRWHNSSLQRPAQAELTRYDRVRFELPVIYSMGCDEWYHSSEVRICTFGPSDAARTAVVMGDSIGLQWFPTLADVLDDSGWRILVVTKSSCPMVDEPVFYPRIGREYTECAKWRSDALAHVASIDPEIVILGSTSTYEFTREQWIDGTARVLAALTESGARVYVLRATPTLPFNGPTCLSARSWLQQLQPHENRCTASAQDARGDDVWRWIQTAALRFTNVSLVDMNDVVCPSGECRAERDGVVVFRDSQHLSTAFAGSLVDALAARMDLPP